VASLLAVRFFEATIVGSKSAISPPQPMRSFFSSQAPSPENGVIPTSRCSFFRFITNAFPPLRITGNDFLLCFSSWISSTVFWRWSSLPVPGRLDSSSSRGAFSFHVRKSYVFLTPSPQDSFNEVFFFNLKRLNASPHLGFLPSFQTMSRDEPFSPVYTPLSRYLKQPRRTLPRVWLVFILQY